MKYHQLLTMTRVESLTSVQENNRFNFYPCSTSIVFSHLSKLSQSNVILDNISAKIIGECGDLISVSSYDLFN